ncbi:DUF2634 domain-containing protein [Aureibacillus halotolerans]|uniref:Uncharacterized protein DUF2634 n=1 Tax=Aureibacillus halotolerans TaxID=1508390 RepID=A0A4R6TV30_9BACI|nr:DUF2634 domain-containing protein [Aureibacillus halotolerans]TDQ35290.1 uncharacterized protein DUF2634 [Aureibacillus halotolerans]
MIPETQMPQPEALNENEQETLRTYALDFSDGRVKGKITGREAIQQFIRKAILTKRYAHDIYSSDTGCETHTLLGQGHTDGYIRSETERMITEALIYDDRIERVYDFNVTIQDDTLIVNFKVDTVEGLIEQQEVIGNV